MPLKINYVLICLTFTTIGATVAYADNNLLAVVHVSIKNVSIKKVLRVYLTLILFLIVSRYNGET